MSIWSSIEGDVKATPHGDYPDNPVTTVDVATAAPWHRGIRLAVWGGGVQSTVVLDPENANRLVAGLTAAVRQVDVEDDAPATFDLPRIGWERHYITAITPNSTTANGFFVACFCGWIGNVASAAVQSEWARHHNGA